MAHLLLRSASLLPLLHAVAAVPPAFPTEYTAVIQMGMPYIPIEIPMRVLTSATSQKVEYYDGLEVDVTDANGTYKYAFNNSRRICLYTPPSAGPTKQASGVAAADPAPWEALPFLPNLTGYVREADELVGGILCEKYSLGARHGSTGVMDDHVSFYWDPVLEKPVRWHMHARHVTFGSHTDEYVMDYLYFEATTPAAKDIALPPGCGADMRATPAQGPGRASRGSDAPLASALLARFAQQAGREAVLKANAHLVERLNEEHEGRATFRANRFFSATRAEVLRFHGGKTPGTARAERRLPEHGRYVRKFLPEAGLDLPKNYDWRTARPGVVGPVKDQAMCGSCWTYSLTEPIESIQAIRTGRFVELPEQFVLDCTWTNGTGASGSNSGCNGGDSDVGALEVIRKFGGVLPSAAAYGSYLSVNGFCKDIRLMDVGARLTAWVDIPRRNEQAVLQALHSRGPLSVGIMVPDEMLFFDSGVLKVEACRCNDRQIDHAVTLVGYGTDEHGTDYYTIRNSWSTYWGDQGYIKIARGDLDCCVSSQAGYPELASASASSAIVV